jgi:hypothetical protein
MRGEELDVVDRGVVAVVVNRLTAPSGVRISRASSSI